MTCNRIRGLFATVLMALAPAAWLCASIDRGSVQGTVTDQQGGAVPGAAVVVKNDETNVETPLITNSAGFYLAAELVPGKYSVHVSASGFSPEDIANVIVTAGATTTADAQLKVGSVSQRVEVTAAAPLVETTPSNFTTAVETRYIQDLPLAGRDIQGLVQLVPGVTQSTGPGGTLFGFNSQYGGFPDALHIVGSGISANGSQGGANAWYLDGSLNAALGPENAVVNPSPDAVSEFNLVDNGLAAEYGRTSGAVINMVLRSGTNDVHGDLYEFNRNSHFSATNPFARRDPQGRPFLQPAVNFNNFGGTLGGPLYLPHLYNGKSRTFFFVSWDIALLHESKPTLLSVPLPNEIQGNFLGDPRFDAVCNTATPDRCIYDPYTYNAATNSRAPFATPVIPSGRIDPLAAFYVASFPAPNFLDPLQQVPGGCLNTCNNFIGPVGSSQTTHNFSVKIDHELSPKNKLFTEWLFNPVYYTNFRYPWNGATAPTQTGVAGAQPYRTINQIFALGLTTTFSPTLVNEARAMFSRQNQIASPNPDSVTDTKNVIQHVQGLNFVLIPPYQVVPTISFGASIIGNNVQNATGAFGPQQWQNGIQGVQAYTFLDNVTKILGKHTLKGGLMFRRDNNWNLAGWGFGLNFGGSLTSNPVTGAGGAGLAQFLLGAVDQGSGTGTYHAPWQTNDYYGFYGQDDFRITPNLTLNLGLRWDVYGWFRERFDDNANFNFSGVNPQVPFAGRLDYVNTPRHPDRNVFPANKSSFGPRLAFSWAPFGNRKTVIRGGFGIIYSNGISAAFGDQNGAISAPAFANYVGYQGDRSGKTPAFDLSQGAPSANLPALDFAKKADDQFLGTAVGGYLKGSHDPYVEQWSLYIQRELPGNVALSVGYVGTHGLHLYGDEFRNYDYVPTAVRQQLRSSINSQLVTVNPSIGPIYGCPTATQCAAFLVDKRFPQYASVIPNTQPDGFNRYNSFQTKVEKRYSHGLNFIVAYTIQKNLQSPNTGSIIGNTATPTTLGRAVGRASFVPGAISGGVGENSTRGIGGGAEDPDNRRRYTGLAPDDIPQILNFAVTYELPFGAGKRFLTGTGPAEKALGGWKLIQNWNLQSGIPLTFAGPCNGLTNLGALSCRPNLIGDPARGRGSKNRQQLENQWYDASAFEANFGSDPAVIQQVTAGTNLDTLNSWWVFGNAGLRPPTGRSPGFWNTDMTLAKELHLTESRYFQFRWEVFNALNHQNLGLPNTSWCLPATSSATQDAVHIFGCQFGRITNVQTDPRAMEFGLKFFW